MSEFEIHTKELNQTKKKLLRRFQISVNIKDFQINLLFSLTFGMFQFEKSSEIKAKIHKKIFTVLLPNSRPPNSLSLQIHGIYLFL